MNELGRKMYLRRKELGLTLEEVGQAVGVGKSTVRRWENGMIKNMGRDKLIALAKALQLNPLELVPYGEQDAEKSEHDARYNDADAEVLEAFHQNPKLRLLFDRQRTLSEADLDAVLGVVNAISKERDADE